MTRFEEVITQSLELDEREAELRTISGAVHDRKPQVELGSHQRLHDLNEGLRALETVVESSDVLQLFLAHAKRQGARLLLLRTWSDGLRVLLAENIDLPRRLYDPKATRPRILPMVADDVFRAVATERVVYKGPFPVPHLAPELAEALGATEDRPVLIFPLPLRGRWGTFVYMDWVNFQAEQLVEDAARLAGHAVLRLHAIESDAVPFSRTTKEIHNRMLARRQARERNRYDDLEPGQLPAEQIYKLMGELTAMPEVAARILQLLRNPVTTATQLEKEIARDFVLTGRILRIANSSFYVANCEARTIREAVVRLGFKTIRNWTLVTASRAAFPDVDTSPQLNRIWRESLLSALGSQIVAEHLEYHDKEIVFIGGLMQNIGQLIVARTLPGLFEMLSSAAINEGKRLWEVEQERLGYDHGTLGGLLVDDWNLGQELRDAVRLHHHLERAPTGDKMAVMVALGEELAGCIDAGPEQVRTVHAQSEAARRLGIRLDAFRDLVAQLARVDLEVCL